MVRELDAEPMLFPNGIRGGDRADLQRADVDGTMCRQRCMDGRAGMDGLFGPIPWVVLPGPQQWQV